MSSFEFRLLNEFQRGFPLVPKPFAQLAHTLGAGEDDVLQTLVRLRANGTVSRVGAVFRPGSVGASTLAAMSVPPRSLASTAERVSAFAEVNHNYEREHALNLWFVAAAEDEARLGDVLRDIERACGVNVLSLPLLEEYHVDLGFELAQRGQQAPRVLRKPLKSEVVAPHERGLLSALQGGLDLMPAPFAALGERCGLAEDEVIGRLRAWTASGVIRRMGIIVRHHELGYGANAMAVWDVPDEAARRFGMRLARCPEVTLCYRRARHLPQWPYNLYCMIHGKVRTEVGERIRAAAADAGIARHAGEVLFSRRRFKQRGRYFGGGERTHESH